MGRPAVYTKAEPKQKHHIPLQQAPHPQQIHHPRPTNIAQPSPHPASPHQHPGPYPSPHPSSHSIPDSSRSPYPQQAGPNGHVPSDVYYQHNPYDSPASGPYSSAEGSEMMAAAQMQRPYQHSVYHTPQSKSPASVASSQGLDHYSRMYAQQPQMQQGIYGHAQYGVPQSAYPQHPPQQPTPQHQIMTSQPLLPQQQGPTALPHQSPVQSHISSPRTQTKLEPGLQRPLDPSAFQRSPAGPVNTAQNPSSTPTQNGSNTQGNQQSNTSNSAAPGPIPATTPLVVRQDNNGVQWIAFEYSRDRVKMEYTIRCDVESVNTDNLSPEFKGENCVYPRACGGKENYKGNRLQYENECNTVGWALAELNPCLRIKRGLIQRAVDSWRNSNQDPRLRSRRVRRQAKVNTRRSQTANQSANHAAGPRDVATAPTPTAVPMGLPGAPMQQRPPPSNVAMAGQTQLHHHHANPDGSQPSGADGVSVNNDFGHPSQIPIKTPATSIRPVNNFYSPYPVPPIASSISIPPQMHSAIDGNSMPSHAAISASTSTASEPVSPAVEPTSEIPILKKLEPTKKSRKYVVVNDVENGNKGVRIKARLNAVNIEDLPDSFRELNSVFPRAYFPVQMQLSPRARGQRGRFAHTRDEDVKAYDFADGATNRECHEGNVMVSVPMGEEGRGRGSLKVPALGRGRRLREEILNEWGMRMSWSTSRVMNGRLVFLQRSLDLYRTKMAESVDRAEVRTAPPVYETRIGKKLWVERRGGGKAKGKGSRE